MTPDPGWRPALGLAARLALLRPPDGSLLAVMRAAAILLGGVAVVTAVLVLVFGGGSGTARIDDLTAQVGLFVAVALAAVVIAVIGNEAPDTSAESALAAWVFRVTMLRVLAAASVGPFGFLLSWSAGDGAWVIYGAGASVLLILVVGPTRRRLATLQEDLGDEWDLIGVLVRSHR